ncbi:Bax inhibitor-1/YccA family protein [Bacteroidota bacterium]
MKSSETTMSQSAIAQAQADFLSKVYAWMFGGLLLTALTAWYVYSEEIYISVVNSGLMFPLILGELALVFFLAARVEKISKTTAGMLFLVYSLLNGITLSVVLAVYTYESVQEVFFITAAMFAALSAYGYFTKKSLSGIGNFLFMGLIGIIIASVVNIFMANSALNFAISVIGVIIFAGLTAYDTQKIKEMYVLQYEGDEVAAKGAIIGALRLYLDFINLFLFLLRLFGRRD